MKNLTLFVFALLMTGNVFAQKGLELTVGFTPGLSFLLNDEDFAEGDNLNIQPTFGYVTGLTVGYNFNEKIGLATGFNFARLGQRYTTDYPNISNDDQAKYDRRLSYIRIPLLLRVGGDNTAGSSAFFRFGPNFDFLTTATGTYYGSKNNPSTTNNVTNFRDIDKTIFGEKATIFNSFVLGMTMEVGGRIRITDQMGVLLLFHLESSFINVEGEDAAAWSGFATSGTITDPERGHTWSLMAGVHVGFHYTFSFE